MLGRITFWSAFLVFAALPALADPGDPPTRVARLNYETGAVSFRPGSVDDWAPAAPNYPLTTGDHLWADRDAQAEMHIGSTALRMNSETALSFLNLDDRTVQLSLTAGTIHVRMRNLGDDQSFEVDTPNVAITLLRPGDYRISADGDNAVSFIAVRAGDAELTAGGSAFPVHPRQAARVTGTDSVRPDLIDVPPPDAFDAFCQTRDRREETSQSVRYVPREMIGYEDLDANGVWREVPPYGMVWTPTRVAVGWAPYRYGHWAWVAPWGWTWVDDAPWGFAPFHYGRWAFVAGGWAWIPGRIVERPVYAPALVAFVGGPHFSLSVSIGGGGAGVAWFPLGPGEVYRPAYHVSNTYVQNVNITHVNVTNINVTNVNVTNVHYVNQSVTGAVTAVPQQAFVSSHSVGSVATVVPPQQAAQAQVMGSTAAVAPRHESIVAAPAAGAPVVHPPAQTLQRTVVAKATPPPPPVSFRAQQQALQTSQGRPLEPAALNNLRPAQPATPQVRAATPRAQVNQAPVPLPPPSNNAPRQPSVVTAPPVNQAPPNQRPAPAIAQPVNPRQPANPAQPNSRPQLNDRPLRNDRPVPAVAQPVNPQRPAVVTPPPANQAPPSSQPINQAKPVNETPNPRPAVEDRPARHDRPAPAAAPANPPRPVTNDRPAAAPGPKEQRKAEPNKDKKEPAKEERKDNRER